jgi:drug/metabolite transporter (DMT)-like permease
MRRYANYLAGVGYASIFGFSFLVTKGALERLDPFELLFLRFSVAALALGLLALIGLIKLDFRGKPMGDLVLACLFQPLLYFTCETFGVRESASSTAGIVIGALPALTAILGVIMLKERLRAFQGFALLLSVAGVALIVLSGGALEGRSGTPRGLLFLLGAVASAAFYNVFSRRASRAWNPIETTFAMMWTGAIVFGAAALVRGLSLGALAGRGAGPGLLERAAPAWAGILYLGLLSSILAFFLINFTLVRLKVSQSVVFSNLTTVISVAAGVVIRGEGFGPVQMLGAAMIVLGVWGTNAAPRSRNAPSGSP